MGNAICIAQNQPKQIIRLAAQRRLYSRAKLLFGWRTTLSLSIAIAGAIFASLYPDWRPYVALVALPYSFLDGLYLDALQKRWTSKAAKIQEMFDCDVLELRWVNFKYGRPVDEEEIIELGADTASNEKKAAFFRDWYPTAIESLPLHFGRILCQRANTVWDKKLRERYTEAIIFILVVVGLVVFCLGLRNERSFEQFVLAVVVPLAPGLLLGIRHLNGLRESNRTLEKLAADVEKLWERALQLPADQKGTTDLSRDLQNQLYDHRKSGQVLFDWLYWLLRTKSEMAMNTRAEDLVAQATAQLR